MASLIQLSFFLFVIFFTKTNSSLNPEKKKATPLPIQKSFKLQSSVPSWPKGGGFGNGTIDLGGLVVTQISSFDKIWANREKGQDSLGATFFKPSPSSIPAGFFTLGFYAQPNNRPLFGWVLAAKDTINGSLKQPIDYTLAWSSQSLNINKEGDGYIWLPTPPDGYKAAGFIVTTTPEKPSLDSIRCVRADFTADCVIDEWVWGSEDGFNVYGTKPNTVGTQDSTVPVGAFTAQKDGSQMPITCLKNVLGGFSSMPNPTQFQALFQAYSPLIYFHPDDEYLPSSVSWFFQNGALLYTKGNESNPVSIDPLGSILPQNGSSDGAYWLDLPTDPTMYDYVKKGNLSSAGVYIHVKPIYGATFSDIAIWVFYPFNGAAKAKVGPIDVSLGKIGEHVGDWEHLALRISNFNGVLDRVYFSQHSKGIWVLASQLEYQNGSTKPVTYSSLHSHAFQAHPGLVLEGGNDKIGVRMDAEKGNMVMDCGLRFLEVAAEYMGSTVVEPPWLNYAREWGPKVEYSIDDELKKVEKFLPGLVKNKFEKFIKSIPNEVLGEEGPTGPKFKSNWDGDEKV